MLNALHANCPETPRPPPPPQPHTAIPPPMVDLTTSDNSKAWDKLPGPLFAHRHKDEFMAIGARPLEAIEEGTTETDGVAAAADMTNAAKRLTVLAHIEHAKNQNMLECVIQTLEMELLKYPPP